MRVPIVVFALVLLPAAPAHAAPQPSGGTPCSMSSTEDPLSPPGTQRGTVKGGPVPVVDPLSPATVQFAELRCVVRVNGSGVHSGPITWKAQNAGPSPVEVPPELIVYYLTPVEPVHLCTQVAVATGDVYYWDAVTSVWSTSPLVPCALAAQAGPPDTRYVP